MTEKFYLGDGVYVRHDGYHVVLLTDDGIRTTNEIYLDPVVLKDFQVWLKHLEEESK